MAEHDPALVELVAEVLESTLLETVPNVARAVLSALADAGRLRQPDTEESTDES